MSDRYWIQELVGYTDGKPSWRTARLGIFATKEDAVTRMAEEISRGSRHQFRVRKMPKTPRRKYNG